MASETRLDLAGGSDDEPKPKSGDEKKRERGDRKHEEAPGARTRRRHESEIRGRLSAVLETIADTLEARGDHELAGAIRDDGRAIVSGLVSVTRPIAWARPVILAGLGVAEPLLAFGRIGRIIGGRWADRRAARAQARAEEAAGAIEPWCTCGAGEYQPPEAHPYPCPGSVRALAEADTAGQ